MDHVVDIRRFDPRLAERHREEIVDLRDDDSRARHGIGYMVDHQREVEGITVGGQLQQDDIDRRGGRWPRGRASPNS